jgi:hypothetical protein
MRLRGLELSQKVVIVVALGVVFAVAGVYVATYGFATPASWLNRHGHALGETDTYYVVRYGTPVRLLLVPLGLVVVWTAFSVWLFGRDERGER